MATIKELQEKMFLIVDYNDGIENTITEMTFKDIASYLQNTIFNENKGKWRTFFDSDGWQYVFFHTRDNIRCKFKEKEKSED